jgi:dethiobiotin synthetase
VTALFVTATGTDIGKTFIAAGLVRALRTAGRPVDAVKPVASGFEMATLAATDTGILLSALGRPLTEASAAALSPWRFSAPLAPDMAAAREGRQVDFDALTSWSRARIEDCEGVLLVEGVGGVMSPLDASHTVLDWVAALRLPVLLAAGSYLGTISHTLSAFDVLERRGMTVLAVVVSETPGSTVDLDETVTTLRRFVPATEIMALPRLAASTAAHAVFETLATRL